MMYNGVLVNSSEDSERAAFQRHITVYASIVLGDASASDPVRVLFAIGSRRGRGLGLGVHSPDTACVYTSEPNFMYPCVVLVLGYMAEASCSDKAMATDKTANASEEVIESSVRDFRIDTDGCC